MQSNTSSSHYKSNNLFSNSSLSHSSSNQNIPSSHTGRIHSHNLNNNSAPLLNTNGTFKAGAASPHSTTTSAARINGTASSFQEHNENSANTSLYFYDTGPVFRAIFGPQTFEDFADFEGKFHKFQELTGVIFRIKSSVSVGAENKKRSVKIDEKFKYGGVTYICVRHGINKTPKGTSCNCKAYISLSYKTAIQKLYVTSANTKHNHSLPVPNPDVVFIQEDKPPNGLTNNATRQRNSPLVLPQQPSTRELVGGPTLSSSSTNLLNAQNRPITQQGTRHSIDDHNNHNNQESPAESYGSISNTNSNDFFSKFSQFLLKNASNYPNLFAASTYHQPQEDQYSDDDGTEEFNGCNNPSTIQDDKIPNFLNEEEHPQELTPSSSHHLLFSNFLSQNSPANFPPFANGLSAYQAAALLASTSYYEKLREDNPPNPADDFDLFKHHQEQPKSQINHSQLFETMKSDNPNSPSPAEERTGKTKAEDAFGSTPDPTNNAKMSKYDFIAAAEQYKKFYNNMKNMAELSTQANSSQILPPGSNLTHGGDSTSNAKNNVSTPGHRATPSATPNKTNESTAKPNSSTNGTSTNFANGHTNTPTNRTTPQKSNLNHSATDSTNTNLANVHNISSNQQANNNVSRGTPPTHGASGAPSAHAAAPSKYTQLLAVIEDMGRDIRPAYAGSRVAAERLKRGIIHSRILVRECLLEAERCART